MPDEGRLEDRATGRPDEAHQMLGRQLRLLREARGISPVTAGRSISGSASKISRIEGGRVRIKEEDIHVLLTLYGLSDPIERNGLLRFARVLNTKQWWDDDRAVLGGWFCSYLSLEAISQSIRTYEVRFIPGLLQTPAYAEAVIRRRYTNETEIRRRVEVRMRRQQAVLQGRTQLWAVIDRAALDEGFAGPQVMYDQIRFLIAEAQRPNVIIQLLPTGAGGFAGIGNSFSILRLPTAGLSDVVYLEHLDEALFLDGDGKSDHYRSAMTELAIEAGDPRDTVDKLRKALAMLQ